MSKIVVLSQARLSSTRLPNKVLINFCNEYNCLTLLQKRISLSKTIDEHVFIVPSKDKSLVKFLVDKQFNYETGSENDLIDRHLKAAKKRESDVIVRITSDCPLVDPKEIDKAIELYLKYENNEFLYISNHTPPEKSTYPNGSDIEVFSLKCLEYINTKYKNDRDREHVTFPMWDGREVKKIKHLKMSRDKNIFEISKIRITLDNKEDLAVFKILASNVDVANCNLCEIENLYQRLKLYNLNSHFDAREGWR